MQQFSGKIAVITGSGSGIGRALALALADAGASLALSDIDTDALAQTAEWARDRGARVFTEAVDVSDRDAVYAHAEHVLAELGGAHLVFNNAGVAMTSPIAEMELADLEWMMGINFWGVVHGTKAFLPHLLAQREGHVVNISSVFGIIGVPTQGAYNAAKFAVRGFTESLRQELDLSHPGVSCTVVCPGGVKTNIAGRARMRGSVKLAQNAEHAHRRFQKAAATTAESAAAQILAGVRKDARRVLIGRDARLIDAMQRLLPSRYQHIVARVTQRTQVD